jgi:predicted DCC family thiol-disulfide oxidoreductase YuxK
MSTVIYDADCRMCSMTKRVCEQLDWLRLLKWVSFEESGLEPDQLYLVNGSRRWGGFSAVKRVAARLPIFYLAILAGALLSPWTLLGWTVVLSPLFQPVGDRLYAWVARNRTCAI